jgi:NADPH:quinone reductase
MRAVVFDRIGDVSDGRLRETADPAPSEREVVVEVRAVAVNYVDLLTMTGRYQFRPALPFTPGKGPSGVVVGVGGGVSRVAVGDPVLAMAEYGGYAELACLDERSVYGLHPSLSFVNAASMSLAYDTAWMALRQRARMRPGESVLVLGATGAVGRAALQLSRAMGATAVFAASSSPDRLLDRGLATAVVDVSGNNLRETIREQVYAANGGRGVDVVIDTVGGDAFDGAVRALDWGGRLVVVGFASGRIPTLKMNYLLLKNIEISGLQISDYRKRDPALMDACYDELLTWFADGTITAASARTFALEDWAAALELLEQRKTRERLVLIP